MSSEYDRQFGQLHDMVPDKTTKMALTKVDAALQDATYFRYTLKPNERMVFVATAGAGSAWYLTMPPVAKCAGMTFSIHMTLRDTVDVTLTDYSTGDPATAIGDTLKGALGAGNVALNLTDDSIVLYCDGFAWRTINSNGI